MVMRGSLRREVFGRGLLTLGAAVMLCTSHAVAAPEAAPKAEVPAEPSEAAPTTEVDKGKAHFKTGVALFREQNFKGSLAEFEEAYRLNPTAKSLTNVALCQQKLFRYAKALSTLEQLLARHEAELDAPGRAKVDQAMQDLRARIGTVTFELEPRGATVSVDGKPLTPEQLRQGLRLDVGEHRVEVQAPGHAPDQRTVRVAGGGDPQPLAIKLRPTQGILRIKQEDADARVFVDDKLVGKGNQTLELTPGRHTVTVRRSGQPELRTEVELQAGAEVELDAELHQRMSLQAEGDRVEPGGPFGRQQGWYLLGGLVLLGSTTVPDGLTGKGGSGDASGLAGGGVGLWGGYRFSDHWWLQGSFDGTSLEGQEACIKDNPTACGIGYKMEGQRLGVAVRYSLGSRNVRFIAGAGLGVIHQKLSLTSSTPTLGSEANRTEASTSGWSGGGMLELGASFNFQRFLLETLLVGHADGTSTLDAVVPGTTQPFGGRAATSVGLAIRAGYSTW